jgi:pyridoxine 5'-phosphate synthase PdxJ
VRATLLIDAVRRVPELAQRLKDAARTLELMTGIYAQSARTAATHRRHPIERRKQLSKAPSPAGRKS